jgi:glycosyltransferase involved in cell wall biosynthesis
MSVEPQPRDAEAPPLAAENERVRLLEHQLEFLRAEMLHLTREREAMIYSAAWRAFSPLRRLEAKLVNAVRSLRQSFARAPERKSAAPTKKMETSVSRLPAQRLLVDVTGTVRRDAGVGIERVVKKITQALYETGDLEIPALAVRCDGGRLFTCNGFVNSLTGGALGADAEIAIAPGDRFLALSDTWNVFEEYDDLFEAVRAGGGEVVSCIYDLIPELYPYACHADTVPRYRAWLRKALLESDGFVAISRTVGEELANFVKASGAPYRPELRIGWFHCGSDVAPGEGGALREDLRAALATDAPVFLCVGTIEPRKGHRTALRAFEELWAKNIDARLVLAGKRGWYVEALTAEIRAHPEFGKRLHWFDRVSDAELSALYDKAAAVLLPSYAEGFGLPIAEAARRGRPAICSDIPVFREVGGDGAAYFRVNDPHALASCVRDWLGGEIATDVAKVSRCSWQESARRLAAIIARDEWSWRLP